MTLRLRRLIGKGKIKENTYKPENFAPRKILDAMNDLAPGISDTAVLQPEQDFTISFDFKRHNTLLENKLRKLRKKGVDFEYYTGTNKPDKWETEAIDFKRPRTEERLFIQFAPKDDLEWAYIRGMFGLPSNVTDEVSDEETIQTIGEE